MRRRHATVRTGLQQILDGPEGWPDWMAWHSAWSDWLIEHEEDRAVLLEHYVYPTDDAPFSYDDI